MRRSLVLLLPVALLVSCCGVTKTRDLPGPDRDGKTFRLATYNVGVFGKSGSNTTGMVASMLKEMGVQAVSLNELDSCTVRHPDYQIKGLADAMGGWNWWFAPALDYQGGKYGIGIISEPGLRVLRRHKLALAKGDGSEPRALAVCEFEKFVFCSTHLDYVTVASQVGQARQICAWVEAMYGKSDKPVILCGDFNAGPDSEVLALMRENWTVLSPQEFTYSAKNPHECIDYVMVYRNAASRVKVLDAAIPTVFATGDVKVASDHLPVYVKFEIE